MTDKNALARFPINKPQVFENLPSETLVGTLEAIDHDYVEFLTFELLDNYENLKLEQNSTICTSYFQRQNGKVISETFVFLY